MKNKLIFIIIAVVLAVSIIALGAVLFLRNTGDTVISLGSVKGLAGDIVEIPLTIDKNVGIWGGQIIINYDSDNLSFLSIDNSEVFDQCEVNDTGDCVAILATQLELEDSHFDGNIATLKFKIKVSADKGEYTLDFNEESNFCNKDEEMITPEFVSGKIIVK